MSSLSGQCNMGMKQERIIDHYIIIRYISYQLEQILLLVSNPPTLII
jgi:hypothetical protein